MRSRPCTPPKKPMAGALGSFDPIAAVRMGKECPPARTSPTVRDSKRAQPAARMALRSSNSAKLAEAMLNGLMPAACFSMRLQAAGNTIGRLKDAWGSSGLAWSSCFDCLYGGDSRSELLYVSALNYEQTCPQELAFFDVHAIGEAFLLQQADFVVIGLGHRKAVTDDLLFFRPFDFLFGSDGLDGRRFNLRFSRHLDCLAFAFLRRLDRCFGNCLAFAYCRLGRFCGLGEMKSLLARGLRSGSGHGVSK